MGLMSFLVSRKSAPLSQSNTASTGTANGVTSIGSHSITMDMDTYLASDEKEWLRYLAQPLRTYRKPGLSMREEYDLWLAARARSRAISGAARAKAS